MARVKRGVSHVKHRKNILKAAKGFKWGRKNKIKMAKTAITKAGAFALADRRKKKSINRQLWQTKLNAAVRPYGISYSRFIDALKKQNIELDRKVLSTIAAEEPAIFKDLMKQVLKK